MAAPASAPRLNPHPLRQGTDSGRAGIMGRRILRKHEYLDTNIFTFNRA